MAEIKRTIKIFDASLLGERGFTIPEVIIAGTIMIILCVGTLTSFSYAVKINRGNNLRMQALSILQLEVEYYRSLKFIPVGSDPKLNADTYTNARQRNSADGRSFNITVVITNLDGLSDANTKFKQITIRAVPQVTESEGWLADLNTEVALQRVRSN